MTQRKRGAADEVEVTEMMGGGFRAECSCGWWEDNNVLPLAQKLARNHVRNRQGRCEVARLTPSRLLKQGSRA